MKIFAVVMLVALTLASRPGAADSKADYLKAEIRGTLKFDAGYLVSIKSADDAKAELRVWLYISENKILARELDGLTGKAVVVKGSLHQMPANAGTSVPPLGLYFKEGDFTIEAAK